MKTKLFSFQIALCLITFSIVISSVKIASIFTEYRQNSTIYGDIAIFAMQNNSENTNVPSNKLPSNIANLSNVDFNNLHNINKNIVGWLYSPNTVINYPIMKADDNSFYLNHLPTGKRSSAGSLFIDCRNNKEDKHIFIYGHHMKDGSMFASLLDYTSQEYFAQHPYLYLYTENNIYKLYVFSSFYTNGNEKTYSFKTNNKEYIDYCNKRSLINGNQNTTDNSGIVTLSTCAYLKNADKFVVQCYTEKID